MYMPGVGKSSARHRATAVLPGPFPSLLVPPAVVSLSPARLRWTDLLRVGLQTSVLDGPDKLLDGSDELDRLEELEQLDGTEKVDRLEELEGPGELEELDGRRTRHAGRTR